MKNKRHLIHLSKKGFTLIELLIVIVIIGILLSTLLPRLVGTRDKAEVLKLQVGMTQVAQALESYYNDNGEYPGTAGVGECLQPGEAVYDALIDKYLNEVPDGMENAVTKFDGIAGDCTGRIAYAPLKNNGIANNGWVLAADVTLLQSANLVSTDIDDAVEIDTDTTPDDIKALIAGTTGPELDLAEASDPSTTIFVINSN